MSRVYRRDQPGSARWTKTMAEIVNLRRARKAKQRRKEDNTAAANRLQFGTAKRLRDVSRTEHEKSVRKIEGHKLEAEDES